MTGFLTEKDSAACGGTGQIMSVPLVARGTCESHQKSNENSKIMRIL